MWREGTPLRRGVAKPSGREEVRVEFERVT